MGDMADFTLDTVMDFEESVLDYRMGHMGIETAIEKGIIDYQGYEFSAKAPSTHKCRYCGKGGLEWGETENGWRLFDQGILHNCVGNTSRKPRRRSNPKESAAVTCRCCGKKNLTWKQINDKWRLFDEDNLHDCPKKPL